MAAVYYEFRATEAICPECSSAVVARVQMVDLATRAGVERRRTEECSTDRTHRLVVEPVA